MSLNKCREAANSRMLREDQSGEGSVNGKSVDTVGGRNQIYRLKSPLVQERERAAWEPDGVDVSIRDLSRVVFKLNMNVIRGAVFFSSTQSPNSSMILCSLMFPLCLLIVFELKTLDELNHFYKWDSEPRQWHIQLNETSFLSLFSDSAFSN